MCGVQYLVPGAASAPSCGRWAALMCWPHSSAETPPGLTAAPSKGLQIKLLRGQLQTVGCWSIRRCLNTCSAGMLHVP